MRVRNCRAYEESDSTYRRWPSAYKVSIVKEDFPEPETPVITMNLFLGNSTSTLFKLWTRAPLMNIFFSLKEDLFWIFNLFFYLWLQQKHKQAYSNLISTSVLDSQK